MPLIPPLVLHGACFLFRTRDEAKKRVKIGGTCFCITKPIEGAEKLVGRPLQVPYLVSNRHVVWNGAASVISVNRHDGNEPDIIETEPTDWVSHPNGDDVAVICIWPKLKESLHKVSHINEKNILREQSIKDLKIGVGDEVFMIGRFINHQGTKENKPAARFGCISMMQEKILVKAENRWQESFAVEMRSRTGFSGSPVAVYRTQATTELVSKMTKTPPALETFWGLLGINWGYILDEDGENTWLNGVVPAWKILDVLETPEMKKRHQEIKGMVEEFARKGRKNDGGVVSAFAGPKMDASLPANDANPNHLEDFKSLLGEAARKREQED